MKEEEEEEEEEEAEASASRLLNCPDEPLSNQGWPACSQRLAPDSALPRVKAAESKPCTHAFTLTGIPPSSAVPANFVFAKADARPCHDPYSIGVISY